jgi:hypothetical protein
LHLQDIDGTVMRNLVKSSFNRQFAGDK